MLDCKELNNLNNRNNDIVSIGGLCSNNWFLHYGKGCLKGINSKRGEMGEKMMIFSFLFLLIIVGGGIVAGIYVFYGGEYDFRGQESEMLAYKIKECFVSGLGNFDYKSKDEFFLACGLNKEIVEKNAIIKLCEDEKGMNCEDSSTPSVFSVGSNFVACKVDGGEKYPQCKILKFSKGGKNFELIVGSNQFSKGVGG